MKISEFFVQNFGIFSGSGTSLSKGLTIFHGENESGKTTLMNFFRRILFPREKYSRTRGNIYEPLSGARHGGSARVRMEDGREFVLTLDGKKNFVLPASGGSAAPLPSNFFSIGKDVYESVFAMGLNDMQSMESLNKADIAARFFSAGSGLGSASLPRLLSSLEERGNELYRPGLAKGASAVNRLLASMKETDERIRELRMASGSWGERRDALDSAERALEQRREELAELQRRLSFLELLEKGLAPRVALGEIERSLGELSALPPFPEGGLDKLERLKDERKRLEASCVRLESEIRAKEEEAAAPASDPLLLCTEYETEIRALEQEGEQLRAALARKNLLERELLASRRSFLRNIEDLCPWWTEEHLMSADISADAIAFARRTAERKEVLERKRGEGEKSLAQWNRLREDRRSEAASLEKEMGVVEKRAKRASERWGLITRLRSVFTELCSQEDELNSLEEARSTLLAERDRALEQEPIPPGIMVVLISAFLLLVGAGAALQAFLASDYLWAFGSATLFMASLLAWFAHKDLSKKYATARGQWVKRLEDLDSRLEETTLLVESQKTRVDRLRTQREELGSSLGINAPRFESAMEHLLAEGEGDNSAQERYTFLSERNRQMATVLARMDAEGEAMEQEVARTVKELETLNEAWSRWLTEHRFDRNLAPRDMEGIVPRILQLRSEEASLAARAAEGRELDDAVEAIRKRIQELAGRLSPSFEALGEPAPSAADPASIRAFSTLLRRAAEKRGEIAACERDAAMLRQNLEDARAEASETERTLNDLFAAAQTDGEDAFRALAEAWRKRDALLAGRLQERKVLLGLFGSDEALRAAEEEYAFRSPEDVRSETESLRERAERARSELDAMVDAKGRISSELERMGTDERLGEQLFARKGMERKLDEHLEEWLSNLLAHHFLEVSRARHERERQPEVIRRAGEYLALMTGDRYHLLSEGDEKGFSVVLEEKQQSRERKDELKWSSGLGDQVYLSMRLALASLWGKNSEPLPLILDDLLVRFDEGRQRGAAMAICEAARENQVMLFTCQKGTLDVFRDVVAETGESGSDFLSFHRIENGEFVPVA